MYALSNEANSVCSIDVSKKAMEIVERNEQYFENKIPHEKLTADVIEYLKQMEESKFDIIILDPPAFAKSLDKRHQAIQAYKRINLLALKNIKTPGFLFLEVNERVHVAWQRLTFWFWNKSTYWSNFFLYARSRNKIWIQKSHSFCLGNMDK